MPKIIVTKEEWVNHGYKVFSNEGITGINVEKMSKKLGVNKSSFYWHFKTKKDFLNDIVKQWITVSTAEIIASTEAITSPTDKFRTLIKYAFKADPELDFIFFLKRHAKKDNSLQSVIETIDTQRMNYTKDILLQMGFSENDAFKKSRLFYKYLIGYHEMIRYKKQNNNYIEDVILDLKQFIKF